MTTAIFFLAALSNSCNQNFEFWDPKMVGSSSHPRTKFAPLSRNAGDMTRHQVVAQETVVPPDGSSMQHQHLGVVSIPGSPRVSWWMMMNDDELLLKIIELI